MASKTTVQTNILGSKALKSIHPRVKIRVEPATDRRKEALATVYQGHRVNRTYEPRLQIRLLPNSLLVKLQAMQSSTNILLITLVVSLALTSGPRKCQHLIG